MGSEHSFWELLLSCRYPYTGDDKVEVILHFPVRSSCRYSHIIETRWKCRMTQPPHIGICSNYGLTFCIWMIVETFSESG